MLIASAAYSQVTIGSGDPPRKGALLDLKEQNNAGIEANATKGLGLPQVALESIREIPVKDNNETLEVYTGLTVYNTTNAPGSQLVEGLYCWMDSVWKPILFVDNKGEKGQSLVRDGRSGVAWKELSLPEFSFLSPTQTFVEDTEQPGVTFPFKGIGCNSSGAAPSGPYTPAPDAFKNNVVFRGFLHIDANKGTGKVLLLGGTVNFVKKTSDNSFVKYGFWGEVTIQIYLNNQPVKTYNDFLSTPSGGMANSSLELFTMIPLNDFGGGSDYPLTIRVSVGRNTYYNNYFSNGGYGNFKKDEQSFLTINAKNVNYMLYE